MMRYVMIFSLLWLLNGCVSSNHSLSKESVLVENNHTLLIDLDALLELKSYVGGLRDESSLLSEEPIYIGDNDEVSFYGEMLAERLPVTIQYGQKERKILGVTRFSIKTSELQEGNIVEMRDKEGSLFAKMRVLFP